MLGRRDTRFSLILYFLMIASAYARKSEVVEKVVDGKPVEQEAVREEDREAEYQLRQLHAVEDPLFSEKHSAQITEVMDKIGFLSREMLRVLDTPDEKVFFFDLRTEFQKNVDLLLLRIDDNAYLRMSASSKTESQRVFCELEGYVKDFKLKTKMKLLKAQPLGRLQKFCSQ